MTKGKNLAVLALSLAVFGGQAVEAGAEVLLVKNGKPAATIVIAEQASDQAREAAQQLQVYLDRISGAKLPVRTEKETVAGNRVLVGHSQAVRDLGVEVPCGFTNEMNEEGFVIRAMSDTVVLAGNEDWHYRGTVYAVNDFLESLGCRWYFPGPYGEVIPKMKTIAATELRRLEQPDFRFRNIWYSGWMPVTDQDQQHLREWMDHNKVNDLAGISLPGDGSIVRLAPPEQYFERHPHIYAVDQKGERVKDMLCLSEPDTVRIAVKTITDTFREDPAAITFGFAPPDGHPMCYCRRCQADIPGFMGKGYGDPSLSDTWFRFVNAIATEVGKEFPDRWLLTNGYANRVRPPEGVESLSPNIGIQSAMIASCTFHRIGDPRCWQRLLYEEVLNRWTGQLDCVFIYDYDPGKGLEGLPSPTLHTLGPDMQYFKRRGVWGFWTEGNNSWMITHLNYYVRAKLMWNTEQSVEQLVRDYCEKFYGHAAEPIERYIWTLETAVEDAPVHETWGRLTPWRGILSEEMVGRLNSLIAEAQRQAKTRDERRHVRVLESVHGHMMAFLDMECAAANGDFQKSVERADAMLDIRDQLAKVDPALLPHTPEWCRDSKTTLEWHRNLYQKLADRAGGRQGEQVALLPRRWEFKKDPEDIGVIYQWYLLGKGEPWDEVDTTLYWQAQGYQDERGWGYSGNAWYRTSFFVPETAKDKRLCLTIGGLYSTSLWVWINGVLVDHRTEQNPREPFDISVKDRLRFGETNHVALLVNTGPPDRDPRGGLHRRVFLWASK
jgi:hypothetical protein